MPTTCVAFGRNNVSNLEKGIAPYIIPFFDNDRAKARKRRKKWVDFIKAKRAHWKPTKHSAVCSEHFKPEDFQRYFSGLPGANFKPRLQKDELGVSVFPMIHASSIVPQKTESDRSKRKRRKVRLIASLLFVIICHFPFQYLKTYSLMMSCSCLNPNSLSWFSKLPDFK